MCIRDRKKDYMAVSDNYMGKYDAEDQTCSATATIDKANEKTSKSLSPKQTLELSKLKLDDYITVTSFTHEPAYSKFILNIPCLLYTSRCV